MNHQQHLNLDFPFHFDAQGRTASTDYCEHLWDLIRQFLLTNPHERVNRPEFGVDTRSMLFQPNRIQTAATRKLTSQASLQEYLGHLIVIEDYDFAVDEANDAQLNVTLIFSVPGSDGKHTRSFTHTL